uniref:Uncharacterized protein n=1 Tax=Siphoviridae sp. ctZHD14 TaxID=2827891 RepID=A0A8S5SW33_9CAUD|nr:MAG TPA: hypothetical protein [Siphoviridae sp. ctZHD14]
MSYGIEVNMAVTWNDKNGTVDGGIHVTDSNGLDLSNQSSGETLNDMIEDLMGDTLKELVKANTSPLDRKIAELEEQLEELYAQKENKEYGLEDECSEAEQACCGQCCNKELEEIDKNEFAKLLDNILDGTSESHFWNEVLFKK